MGEVGFGYIRLVVIVRVSMYPCVVFIVMVGLSLPYCSSDSTIVLHEDL